MIVFRINEKSRTRCQIAINQKIVAVPLAIPDRDGPGLRLRDVKGVVTNYAVRCSFSLVAVNMAIGCESGEIVKIIILDCNVPSRVRGRFLSPTENSVINSKDIIRGCG